MIEALERGGLIVKNAEEPPGYLPARPLERIAVAEVIEAARGSGGADNLIGPEMLPSDPAVAGVVSDIDLALAQALQGRSLQDLLDGKTSDKERLTALS